MTDAARTAIQIVVGLLVAGSYEVLEAMTRGARLSALDMSRAIESYGRTLVSLPSDELESVELVRVDGAHPPTLLVAVDLWTKEEGRSDLTAELRLTDRFGGAYEVELMDIHVL